MMQDVSGMSLGRFRLKKAGRKKKQQLKMDEISYTQYYSQFIKYLFIRNHFK